MLTLPTPNTPTPPGLRRLPRFHTMKTRSLPRTLCVSGLLAGALLSLAAPAAAQVDKTAIKAGKVMTMNGEPIEDGVIVIEGGKITAVGKAAEVEIPWDADVIEKPGLVAFPGYVEAHVARGIDRANESLDIAPFLNVRDSIDPVNVYFEEAIRNGILTINVSQGVDTVIAGQSMVVRPHGMTVEAMMVKPNSGITMSAAPRRGKTTAIQAQALRGAFEDLRRYLEAMVQRKKDGSDYDRREALYQGREIEGEDAKGRPLNCKAWNIEGFELVPRGEVDEKRAPLLAVVEGRLQAFIYCASPLDVHTALRVAEANGFTGNTTLYLAPGCWKAAKKIKEAGVSLILSSSLTHTERDPLTGEIKETFVPKVYHDHGITFALASSSDPNRSMWFQAAQCVANGIPRADAMAAITTVPAKMLGLEKRVGALQVGGDGNVALLSGDPLSVTTVVEHVVLGGKHVYDRANDVRVKQLLDGTARPGADAPELQGEEPWEGDGDNGEEITEDGNKDG